MARQAAGRRGRRGGVEAGAAVLRGANAGQETKLRYAWREEPAIHKRERESTQNEERGENHMCRQKGGMVTERCSRCSGMKEARQAQNRKGAVLFAQKIQAAGMAGESGNPERGGEAASSIAAKARAKSERRVASAQR